jgi:hypothetical protein
MSRPSALVLALTTEPATTSELYDRVGYPTLVRLGLIPYEAFRSELARLSTSGLIDTGTARDGSTLWWLPTHEDSQTAD